MEDEFTERVPYLKPIRWIELILSVSILGCWSARDTVPKYYDAGTFAIFILMYTTNSTFTIIFLIDVICQISADPIDYTPMLLILLTAMLLYVLCGTYLIVLIVMHIYHYTALVIVSIILSFIMAVICLCDMFCLIKRVCGYQ